MSKPFLITAAIPYVNAKPHIGHALEFTQADVLARYNRAKGEEVCYVTGADENSLKIVQAAEKEGITPLELSDKYAAEFVKFLSLYNISIDVFQRSSSAAHKASAQELWRRCEASGDIYKKSYKGLYCVSCEAFYTPAELAENGDCRMHPGKKAEEVNEENYFFKLSKYQDQLIKLIESDTYKILPESRKNEALGFIKQGLEDFSVSRSVGRARGWGVPVPTDESQIMYVWFDALNVYRSARPDAWPADLHVIGKDIMRFHAVYWPAMLLSAQIELPKELFIHGFVTMNGQKMSKSLGNTVDPLELVTKYGADAVRYYLLREIPSDDDGDFSEEKFLTRYNADLANGIGNFTARVLTLAKKAGLVGEGHSLSSRRTSGSSPEVESAITHMKATVGEHVGARKLHDALADIMVLISFGDRYVNMNKPWEMETGSAEQKTILENCVAILDAAAAELAPFLPATSAAILARPTQPLFPRL